MKALLRNSRAQRTPPREFLFRLGARRRLCSLWREFVCAVRGILGELTDQSAYRRHLAAHGAVDSPEEWRRFQDHVWGERQRRGRCC